jgi:FkbM family methyltransferase
MTKRKVFIDGGAHHATSLKFFRKHHPNAEEYETHSFEINSDFSIHFDGYIKDPRHHFYPVAIWTEDTEISFWKMAGESSTVEKYLHGSCNAVAPAINFSKWIKSTFSPEDEIILKLDIEGAEYEVLPDLISSGALGMVDKLYIEFHYGKRRSVSLEDHLILLEELIFEQNKPPLRWNATGKKTDLDTIDLQWRAAMALDKEKDGSDKQIRWQKIKKHFGIEHYSTNKQYLNGVTNETI